MTSSRVAKLDAQIEQRVATYNELVISAKFFSMKNMFAVWETDCRKLVAAE